MKPQSAGGFATAASLTPEQRSAKASHAATARWARPRRAPVSAPPRHAYLVHVWAPGGTEPQLWYEPLMNAFGKIVVKPAGIRIVGEPIPLPQRARGWEIEEAVHWWKNHKAA